jgi:hypothetical protein
MILSLIPEINLHYAAFRIRSSACNHPFKTCFVKGLAARTAYQYAAR